MFSVWITEHTNIEAVDPVNAKTILTGHTDASELIHARQFVFLPVVGKRMIATNGAGWTSGKQIIRKSLTKDQVR
jgi:hypothetical protein